MAGAEVGLPARDFLLQLGELFAELLYGRLQMLALLLALCAVAGRLQLRRFVSNIGPSVVKLSLDAIGLL